MKKITTSKVRSNAVEKKEKVVAPLNSSLDFIRFFARVYNPKESTKAFLSTICVN